LSRREDALSLARGEVRDGVAAVQHLLQVLASRRVGSRALARAVPELAAGCAHLSESITALAEAVSVALAEDPEGVAAARALLAHAGKRSAELHAALGAPRGESMEARERLALESVVRRVAADLRIVVRLVDMLGATATSETVTIDFVDAVAARRPAKQGAPLLTAAVELQATELSVGDVRLVLDLLEEAVLTVARAGVAAPRILVARGPDALPAFTVGAVPPEAAFIVGAPRLAFEVVLRDELPSELEVVRAVARRAGVKLAIAADRREVTLGL
jgi:hypothetical protein